MVFNLCRHAFVFSPPQPELLLLQVFWSMALLAFIFQRLKILSIRLNKIAQTRSDRVDSLCKYPFSSLFTDFQLGRGLNFDHITLICEYIFDLNHSITALAVYLVLLFLL